VSDVPVVLRSGEIAFLRADVQAQGVFYASGKPGGRRRALAAW